MAIVVLCLACPAAHAQRWEHLLEGLRCTQVQITDRVWLLTSNSSFGGGALLSSPLDPVAWDGIACTRYPAGIAACSGGAWLAAGHAPVDITKYGSDGYVLQPLPEAHYTEAEASHWRRRQDGVLFSRGYIKSMIERELKPLRYVEGIAANDKYLWAWFMGGMIMMTPLTGKPDWQPHRYAAQFDSEHRYFFPRRGWAWHKWLISAAAPEAPFSGGSSGWPTRICVLSAANPGHGRRLQPPPKLAGYTIRSAALDGDRLWVLGENQGRVIGFEGPHWSLSTISLPDFAWHKQALPDDFQQWRPKLDEWEARQQVLPKHEQDYAHRDRWIRMAVSGSEVVIGTQLGEGEQSDIVRIDLHSQQMAPIAGDLASPSFINDLELTPGMLWVAHDKGLSRLRLDQ